MADDGPVTNPPVPLCPRCNTNHFPNSGCPTNPGEHGMDPEDP